jgi:hypothetical protein
MNFLSNVLREDGGFEYKKAIVDAILVLIRDIPEAKEMGLAQLCEFIEDCEFTFLSVQILHLLGVVGPRTKDPGEPPPPPPLRCRLPGGPRSGRFAGPVEPPTCVLASCSLTVSPAAPQPATSATSTTA